MHDPWVAAVDEALYEHRALVRHHAMRRTLWVMTPEVARLAHAAATAKIARAERKRTVAALTETADVGDGETWLDHATEQVVALLAAGGSMTTRAIGQELPHLVLPVTFGVRTKHPAALNAHTKVLQGAGFDATLLRSEPSGSWNSAEYAWVGTEDWLGHPIAGLEERPAAAELLSHWLHRFGPATEVDIKWWFGWTASLTQASLDAVHAAEVELDDGTVAYMAAGDDLVVDDPGHWVRLLPGLDPTAMGWKERDWYIDPALVPRLFDRFGNAGPTVWVDGEIVGGWLQRPTGEIAVELHRELGRDHQQLLEEAVAELEQAIGDVIVRPRFPAPAQKDLWTRE